MKKNNILRKAIFTIVACILMTMLISTPLTARELVDTDRACTLDLTYKYEDTLFSGAEVKIYKVAAFSIEGVFELTGAFKDYSVDVVNVKSQDEWNALAETFSAYIIADAIVPTATATTDTQGIASFTDVEVGLYLVSGFVADYTDGATVRFGDFLISVPGIDEDDKWVYEVDAFPKPVYHEPKYEDIEFSLIKLWKDPGNENKRPASINVDIYKDGALFESVVLKEDNNWSFSWTAKDDGSIWKVVERGIPEKYTVTFENRETSFIITNTYGPDSPPTGDSTSILPYVMMLCASGVLLVIFGILRRKKDKAEAA